MGILHPALGEGTNQDEKPSLLPAWPLLPSPRLRLIPTTWADTDSATMESDTPDSDTPDSDTMDSDTESTARGRPRLSLRPSLRLLLMPTTPTDTDSDTMDLDMPDSDTVDSDMPDSDTMDSDIECTARGRPRLSLGLMLMPTTWADTMDSDTVSDTMDSDTECTARGRPRLSLRLLLILTTDTDILVSDTPDAVTDTVWDTPDTVTDTTVTDTVTDTTDGDVKATADKLHQDLSVNQQLKCGQKWILSV